MFEHILSGFFIGFAVYLIYMIKKCHFQVNEGTLVVLSSFGKALFLDEPNKYLQTYSPGLHFKWPWQKIHTVSIMEQMIDLSGEEGGTMTMTSDGTLLRIDSKLRFTPLIHDLYSFLFSVERPAEHIKGLFICLLHQEIGCFENKKPVLKENNPSTFHLSTNTQVGSYAAIRSERGMLNKNIQEFCRSQIADCYGIRFEGVDVTDILPPDELAQALNAVINAQSEAQRLYAQTEAECEQKIMAAKKGISIAKAKAKATEEDIGKIAQILSELQNNGTLELYIDRRNVEVFSESRISYVKRPT